MQPSVMLTIDGAHIQASRAKSVLDVAIEYGICIPHLCHLGHVSDFGACRLCIVEHVKNGRSVITTSCTLRVQEGMVIRTNTEKIRKLRRNIAELLVAEAPNSRAIQDIAVRCGDHARFHRAPEPAQTFAGFLPSRPRLRFQPRRNAWQECRQCLLAGEAAPAP